MIRRVSRWNIAAKEDSRMSKLEKLILTTAVLSLLMVVPFPANAQSSAGCKTGKFVGTYTNTNVFADLWGDGSGVTHTFVYQLTLHADGTATQEFTGSPDIMLSGGTGTPFVGAWTCRKDGKLVVTMLTAIYGTTTDAVNHPASVPTPPPVDLFLAANSRVTYLFAVTDDNTLTRIEFRRRGYPSPMDPSDPTAGILGALNTTEVVYTRLVASDADLLAP
jgi:hypothetical protein